MTCPEIERLRREIDQADAEAGRFETRLAEVRDGIKSLERSIGRQHQAIKRLEHEIEEIEGGDR